MENERMLILQMVSEKKITVTEGVQLLKALETSQATAQNAVLQAPPAPPAAPSVPAAPRPPHPPTPPGTPQGFGIPEIDTAWTGDVASKIGSFVGSLISNFGFGMGEGYRFEESFEGEFGAGQEPIMLDLSTRNGRVAIQAWDRPGYMVQLLKHVRGVSEQEAKVKADGMAEIKRSPNELSVRMKDGFMVNSGMAIVAYLPRDRKYTVLLNTANGRIEATGLQCTTVVGRTANGAVKLDMVDSEKVTVTTSNGKVLLKTSANEVQAHSSNGRVVLIPTSSAQHARTRYDLTTSNGSVRIKTSVTSDTGLDFDLRTTNGKIELPEGYNLEYQVNEKHHGLRAIKGRTPGFEQKQNQLTVIAHTSNGKISLSDTVDWE